MSARVNGKVAVITGAARGQGRAHAVRLAEEGADVIVLDSCRSYPGVPYPGASEADLAETVRLVTSLGRRAHSAVADVRDFEELKGAVDAGVAELGRLDIVSANAGIGGAPQEAHLIAEDDWRQMIDINLSGVWHTVKAAAPHLISSGEGGSVIMTSSAAGLKGFTHVGHYVAAKHGVVGLMRAMALELAPHKIRVNSIHPGGVDTDMIQNESTYRMFRPELENPTREDFAEVYERVNALPVPWVDSVDISNAVLFLASDEARYITGAALPVDAGYVLK